MKGTNFKTRFGITLFLSVFCCLMAFNVHAQVNTATYSNSQEFKIETELAATAENKEFTFTVPVGVYSIQIECWGAGAAGAYIQAPGFGYTPIAGTGGGGGAYARLNTYAVTPGQQLTVYVGHGGSGLPNTRGNGGDSYVKNGSTVVVKAAGAPAVADNTMNSTSLGGRAANCIGDVKFNGGNGGKGYESAWCCSGAGGGAAGSAGYGSDGQDGRYGGSDDSNISEGGAAGTGNPLNGNGANGVVSHYVGSHGSDGAAGHNYGGGGSGGATTLTCSAHGGNGGNGIVIISYNICTPATAGTITKSAQGCGWQLVNATAGQGTNARYSWEKSDDGTTNWTVVSNATDDSYVPAVTGFYRRGTTADCGATAYTDVIQVTLENLSAGYISFSNQPAVNTIEFCKNNLLDTNLQANIGVDDIDGDTTIIWQYSLDNGNSWDNADTTLASQSFNIHFDPIVSEIQYRYYYEPAVGCPVYCDGVAKVTLDTGVIYKSDFLFNNAQVDIVLPYGVSTTTPVVVEPSYSYVADVTSVTNDLTDTANNGTLFGEVGVGQHIITWTVKDCAHPAGRQFQQVYNVSYPQCGEGFTVTDADGNEYQTVRVGAQCWMKQNLKVMHYEDTVAIAQSGADTIIGTVAFNNDEANVANYGKLYSWYAAVGVPENSVMAPQLTNGSFITGACPAGWHLPTNAQYQELLDANIDGTTPKSILPQAGLYNGSEEVFQGLNVTSAFWSVDSARPQGRSNFICNGACDNLRQASVNVNSAMSIRCIHN